MKIVNYDADKDFVDKIWASKIPFPRYVKGVLETLERTFYRGFNDYQDISKQNFSPSPVRKFECGRYENLAVLLHAIPIYLRNDGTRPIEYQGQYEEIRIVDLLGAYISRGPRKKTPYIELYLREIYSAAEEFYEKYKNKNWFDRKPSVISGFKYLLTKVLIHELAHAALDIFNLEDTPSSDKLSTCPEFRKWREESMANAVALRIIKDFSEDTSTAPDKKTFYEYAKKFMQEMQPEEYALGVLMEEFDADDFNSVFEAKIKGVDPTLQQEWLDYVQGKTGTPLNWNGLKAWNAKINSTFLS